MNGFSNKQWDLFVYYFVLSSISWLITVRGFAGILLISFLPVLCIAQHADSGLYKPMDTVLVKTPGIPSLELLRRLLYDPPFSSTDSSICYSFRYTAQHLRTNQRDSIAGKFSVDQKLTGYDLNSFSFHEISGPQGKLRVEMSGFKLDLPSLFWLNNIFQEKNITWSGTELGSRVFHYTDSNRISFYAFNKWTGAAFSSKRFPRKPRIFFFSDLHLDSIILPSIHVTGNHGFDDTSKYDMNVLYRFNHQMHLITAIRISALSLADSVHHLIYINQEHPFNTYKKARDKKGKPISRYLPLYKAAMINTERERE